MKLVIQWLPPGRVVFGGLQTDEMLFNPPVTNLRIERTVSEFLESKPPFTRIVSKRLKSGFPS